MSSVHCTHFRVGGVSVQVGGDSWADVTLASSLDLFRVDASPFDIDVQIERSARLPDATGRKLFDSGAVWRLFESEGGFRFDFSTPAMGAAPYKRLIVDGDFRQASLLINDECFARGPQSAPPLGYPLDELLIMHRLTQEKAIELHGCGIVRADGTGNLFVGHSGAGKSTTTRLWTARENVHVLSDDRIIVRRDEGGSAVKTPCRAAGGGDKREVLRLRDYSASRSDPFAQDDSKSKRSGGMRMYGTPWHGEAAYASPGSAPLARIFILEHGRGNVLTRLSASQAVGELFARSFVPFHRHEYVDSALEFLHELVGTVPVYHYAFEPTEAAVERILEFRD
jgi:hypothetical protein